MFYFYQSLCTAIACFNETNYSRLVYMFAALFSFHTYQYEVTSDQYEVTGGQTVASFKQLFKLYRLRVVKC